LGIKSVPIEFSIDGKKRRKIKIPSITEMEIEGLAGSDPDIESHHFQILLAMIPLLLSTRHTYKDHGLEWDNSGRNAFYSRFAYGA
jgi:hypothetical protein